MTTQHFAKIYRIGKYIVASYTDQGVCIAGLAYNKHSFNWCIRVARIKTNVISLSDRAQALIVRFC